MDAGYAVVFLSRRHSIQPFTKGLPSGDIVDRLTQILTTDGGGPAGLDVRPGAGVADAAATVATALVVAQRAARGGTLLRVSFETLFEYLTYLRAIAGALRPLGADAALYLAAAVSDFYIPFALMATHKIQSAAVADTLTLTLTKTPKMLGALRREWAPAAFCVGFKLETDEAILVAKAAASIRHYGLHCVVANILETRKERVLLVTPEEGAGGGGGAAADGPPRADAAGVAVAAIDRDPTESCIERQLVTAVVRLHAAHRAAAG